MKRIFPYGSYRVKQKIAENGVNISVYVGEPGSRVYFQVIPFLMTKAQSSGL
jgi:hypothetical protein